MSSDFTSDTISVLQPLIKKPTLKAALLQKPPFRFLHDIITNLQASPSAFPPPSLFSPDQLQSEQVKEKEQKLAFLQRVIAIVSAVNEAPVDVSPGKIIAGLEPEKTNDLLRALARAAQRGLSEAQVVERVEGAPTKKAEEAKSPAAAPSPRKAEAPASAPAPAPAPAAAAAAKSSAKPSAVAQPPSARKPAASPRGAPTSPAPASRRGAPAHALPPAPAEPEEYFATTQRLLGALITKPSLKAALLQKPPFRFLHDIVTALIASPARFPADYFTAEENNSAAFDSSDKKVAFLHRLIDVIEAAGGGDLSSVSPKKIVAGLEPEKTNLMLQGLARAAASGVTAKEAMANKTKTEAAAEDKPVTAKGEKPVADKAGKAEKAEKAAVEQPAARPAKATAPVKASSPTSVSPAVPKLALQTMENEDAAPSPVAFPTGPPAASPVSEESMAGRPERPMTARQGPPKPKPSSTLDSLPPSTSSPAPAPPSKPAAQPKGLILEGESVPEDEDIPDEPSSLAADHSESLAQFDEEKVNLEQQGNLMRKIIQSTQPDHSSSSQEEKTAPTLADVRAAVGEDKAQLLKGVIQRVCHSVVGLGKCFDFVVDDLDEMAREMSKWRQQREEYSQGLAEATRMTARVVEPLVKQLEEAEHRVDEWDKKVMTMKCQLYANEQLIFRLMSDKVAAVDQ